MASNSCSSNAHSSHSTIELSVSCRGLRNRDLVSRSDPYLILYTRGRPWNAFYDTEVGRTEVITDCLSPAWTTKLTLQYRFSALQPLKFEVWDRDEPAEEKKDDFLGLVETTLAEILARGPSRQVVLPLRSQLLDGLDMGELIIVAEEVLEGGGGGLASGTEESRLSVRMLWSGEHLPLTGAGGRGRKGSSAVQLLERKMMRLSLLKKRTFLEVSRSNEDGSWSVVYRGKAVAPGEPSETTAWKAVELPLRRLCNGEPRRPLRLEVFKWKSDGQHRLLGSVWTSLEELLNSSSSSTPEKCVHPILPPASTTSTNVNLLKPVSLKPHTRFTLEGPGKDGPSQSTSSLVLREISISDQAVPSFLDYISGNGTQLHFAVAIDFTASNGHPSDSRSLHALHQKRSPEDAQENPNGYEIALRAVGDIIAQYDSLRMYPAFGFGAQLPVGSEGSLGDSSKDNSSSLFHLNYRSTHPYCVDVASILGHYRETVSAVRFTEPTRLAPVIRHTSAIADRYSSTSASDLGKHYFILLILTDGGGVDDLPETVAAIVSASGRPMSIVIVGVGDGGEDGFATLQALDGDDGYSLAATTSGGRVEKVAERDIVQFVPLGQFLGGGDGSSTAEVRREELAQEVLAEVPRQLVDYMVARGIRPRCKVQPGGAGGSEKK